jgi:hypothetical protein
MPRIIGRYISEFNSPFPSSEWAGVAYSPDAPVDLVELDGDSQYDPFTTQRQARMPPGDAPRIMARGQFFDSARPYLAWAPNDPEAWTFLSAPPAGSFKSGYRLERWRDIYQYISALVRAFEALVRVLTDRHWLELTYNQEVEVRLNPNMPWGRGDPMVT